MLCELGRTRVGGVCTTANKVFRILPSSRRGALGHNVDLGVVSVVGAQ